MQWNDAYIPKIKDAKTSKDLLAIYQQMKDNAVLHYDFDKKEHNNLDLSELSLEDQKGVLLDLLNKNHLYVLQTEIDDPTYKVSEEDKKLNKDFFKKLYKDLDAE
jgi:adenine-specific DNA-methyltransferase